MAQTLRIFRIDLVQEKRKENKQYLYFIVYILWFYTFSYSTAVVCVFTLEVLYK